jgi:hypothetical protein
VKDTTAIGEYEKAAAPFRKPGCNASGVELNEFVKATDKLLMALVRKVNEDG